MTTRSVSFALEARVSGFTTGMATAAASVRTFTGEIDKSAAKRQALTDLGNTAGKIGLAAAVGVGIAVKSFADFDKAMSNVQAATHETSGNMDQLRQAALDAGAETVFSATESAAAIENLAKAGVSTKDILAGGLSGALDLAAAGNLDVATAAEAAATAMTQFGLSGDKVPHIADLLAAGAGKAQGEVTDLSMALNQAGLVADQTGLSIEETTGGLASFASAGLIGSDAGTSFKTMLQSLTPRSDEAAQLMGELGINAYDAQGNFIGLAEYAGKLATGLGDMSAEQRNATLKTIFGSDAIRAASVLYEQGQKGINGWINAVDDQGYAAETAAIKLDNLSGDLEALKGSLETALIGTGEGANGPLRSLIQTLTDLVNAYNKLPGPVKAAVLALGGIVAIGGGLAYAFTKIITMAAATRTSMGQLGLATGRARTALTMLGRGAGVLTGLLALKAVLDGIAESTDDAAPNVNLLSTQLQGLTRGSLTDIAGDLGDLGDALDELTLYEGGAYDFLDDILAMGMEPKAVREATADIAALDQALVQLADNEGPDVAADAFKELAQSQGLTSEQAAALMDRLPEYAAFLEETGVAATLTGRAHKDWKSAASMLYNDVLPNGKGIVDEGTKGFHRQAAAIDDVKRSVTQLNNAYINGLTSTLDFNASIRDLDKSLGRSAASLHKNTDAGDETWRMMIDAATAAGEFKAGTNKSDAAIKTFSATLMANRKNLGLTQKEVRDLVADFFKVKGGTTDASNAVNTFTRGANASLSGIDDERVDIALSAQASDVMTVFGVQKAAGGPIVGGRAGRDSVPALLMPGEHVWTDEEVRKSGGHEVMYGLRKLAKRGELPKRGDVGLFAAGGPVVDMEASGRGMGRAVGQVENQLDAYAARIAARLGAMVEKFLTHMPMTGAMGPGGTLAPAQIARGQKFAKSQAGKPYGWGHVGPGSYDCSGFVGAVLRAARGEYPHVRVGTTATMPWGGSSGPGRYTIGWFSGNPGHTAGNIGGLGVESAGGVGVRLGSAATSPSALMFNGMFHYDKGGILPRGLTLALNTTGGGETVHVGAAPRGDSNGRSGPLELVGTMQIVNWETGEARFRGVARDEIDSRVSHTATMSRHA